MSIDFFLKTGMPVHVSIGILASATVVVNSSTNSFCTCTVNEGLIFMPVKNWLPRIKACIKLYDSMAQFLVEDQRFKVFKCCMVFITLKTF